MAIIVEDGTIVADANSYATRAEYIAYAANRGVVVTDDVAADVELIKAMDFLNVQCWIGEPVDLLTPQSLPWPRKGLVEGDLDDDWVYSVPRVLKNAQMQLAMYVRQGIDLMPARSADAEVKKEKIGPIETEYFEPASYMPDIPLAAAMIAPLQCGQGGFKLRTYRV